MFLDDVRIPVSNLVGAENDGWRVANVTLRFERGTAFAQHIITLRVRAPPARRARRRRAASGTMRACNVEVGHLDARIDGCGA